MEILEVHERPWSPLAQPCWALEDFPAIPAAWAEEEPRQQAYASILELDMLDPTHAMAHAVS